jgi:hypothetical protein
MAQRAYTLLAHIVQCRNGALAEVGDHSCWPSNPGRSSNALASIQGRWFATP